MKVDDLPKVAISPHRAGWFMDAFIEAGLCQSAGEFKRHLEAGAIRIGVGSRHQAVIECPALHVQKGR